MVKSTPSSASSPANAKFLAPVKFSSDTERLQLINSIRKAPVGPQVLRVINLLFVTRQALTAEQINEACYVDINANKAALDCLRNNPKVDYDGIRFSYKSKHDSNDNKAAFDSLRNNPRVDYDGRRFSYKMVKSTPSSASSPVNAKFLAPIKFSNDTERLQLINSIRKAPVGPQILRVINLLFETRQALTPEQINEACYVDTNANKAIFDGLRNNPKVDYDGRRFSYKSKHDLKDDNQLLVLIRRFRERIAVNHLKDSNPNVMEDLQLRAKYGCYRTVTHRTYIAYASDPEAIIKADDDSK